MNIHFLANNIQKSSSSESSSENSNRLEQFENDSHFYFLVFCIQKFNIIKSIYCNSNITK